MYEISPSKEIEYLQFEWAQLERSTEWNFGLIEKHRNYGFVFVAAIFGVTGTDISTQSVYLWLVVPPIIVILICRIVTQLEFIAIRLDRRHEIEKRLREITGNPFLFCMESMFSTSKSSTYIYGMTYFHIFTFFLAVFGFAMVQVYGSFSTPLFVTFVAIYSVSLAYAVFGMIKVSVRGYKTKVRLQSEAQALPLVEKDA